MNKLLLFTVLLLLFSCTVEDIEDCSKITSVDAKPSGCYLTLENNIVIYINNTSTDYTVGEYYCFK